MLKLTDINMPGSMDGLKLAHAVRYRWPPIKIILVSGGVRLHPSELPSNSCFVAKPYQVSALPVEADGYPRYRIKSKDETFERAVAEHLLSLSS